MAGRKSSSANVAAKPSPKPKRSPGVTAKVLRFSQSIISVLALSLAVSTAREELSPLYGGVATNLYLRPAVATLSAILAFSPVWANPAFPVATALSTILAIAPLAYHRLAGQTARLRDPRLGPPLSYLPVLLPAIYLTTSVVRSALFFSQKRLSASIAAALVVNAGVLPTQYLWTLVPYGGPFSRSFLLVVSSWIVASSETAVTALSRSRSKATAPLHHATLLVTAVLSLLTLTQPPTRPLTLPYLHPSGLLRVLSSEASITGRIVVAETLEHGFRYLRADASILGGVWMGDKVISMDRSPGALFARDKNGELLGDSIYSAFILQEAVRLQRRETLQKDALTIGLGIGVAAEALKRHGLKTTVIEIDPAVYRAARDYFGFSEPDELHLEDARGWVHRAAATGNATYDIVLHDCFSGGGVPDHLFTVEFWSDLRKLVRPDGIVAVNFAGKIGSAPSKAILATLEATVGHCRVYHDYNTELSEEEIDADFINIVFFCSTSSKQPEFRRPVQEDFLNSYMREHILQVFRQREVTLDRIRGNVTKGSEEEAQYILTDARNPLGRWEDEGALEHWKLMRGLLGDIYWEIY